MCACYMSNNWPTVRGVPMADMEILNDDPAMNLRIGYRHPRSERWGTLVFGILFGVGFLGMGVYGIIGPRSQDGGAALLVGPLFAVVGACITIAVAVDLFFPRPMEFNFDRTSGKLVVAKYSLLRGIWRYDRYLLADIDKVRLVATIEHEEAEDWTSYRLQLRLRRGETLALDKYASLEKATSIARPIASFLSAPMEIVEATGPAERKATS